MSNESLIAYVNGEHVAKDRARTSVFDLGFLRGDAVSAYDLHAAGEVFLTSTAGGIVPRVEIDGRPRRPRKPGPVSQRTHARYCALRESGRDGTAIFPATAG